jgi:hypothetical protein
MATAPTNWIQAILFGYRTILTNGVPVISRSEINIVGLTVLDDPVNKRTNITFAGANIPTDAPVANTIVSRNGAGGSSFTSISVYDNVPPLGVQTAYINGATGMMYADNGFSFQSEIIERAQPYKPIYSTALWTIDTFGRIITSSNTAAPAHFDLDIPDGATLTAVEVWVLTAAPHVGLPASMPAVIFNQIAIETGGTSALAGETDQSADVTAFELPHRITLDANSTAPLTPTVINNADYYYRVKVTTESSSNALAGCTILGIKATYTTTEYRK